MYRATALKNAIANAYLTLADAGTGAANWEFYDGTPPASADAALSGNTLLASFACSDPVGTVSSGVLTFSAISSATASASGTPTFGRLVDSDDNVVIQVTAGLSGAEVNFNSALVSGQSANFTGFTITVATESP